MYSTGCYILENVISDPTTYPTTKERKKIITLINKQNKQTEKENP